MAGPWDKYAAPVAEPAGPWAKYATPVATPQETAPADERSFGQNVAAGAGKFVADTGQGLTQLLHDSAAGLENTMPEPVRKAGAWLNDKLGMDSAQDIQARGRANIAETRRLDAPLMETAGGKVGYVGGGIATAPLLPVASGYKGAMGLGGLLGFSQPALDWQERAANTGIGVGAGGVGQGATNTLARLVRPNTSANVNALLKEGVTPTPGQVLGGAWQRAEEGLTSIPIVGDAIKAGQRRATEDMNRAAFNRALAPIGEKLPAKLQGRDAVEHTYGKLGDAYDALLPKMTTQADGQFATAIDDLKGMVSTGAMDPNAARAFERILQNDVLGKFQGQNTITGQTLKRIESDLTNQIKRFGLSQDADQRLVGDALKEVQSNLRALVQRTNPQYATELKAINEGYANFKRVQKAASVLGAEEGVFTAAQLQNAVRASDRSKDKARFAEGNALMQDLSEASKNVLGNRVPDSGTPYRTLTALAAGGGAQAALGPGTAAAVMAAPLMYSRPGQNALAALLARRPDKAADVAELIRLMGPKAALGTSALAVQK